jgi:hypothetical protein
MIGLASSAFARHYLRNHCCFLFLWVLRCFTSPRSLYPPYIFRRESLGRHAAQRGFPIRRSSDRSSFISSPRLIADYYVLHRLQMPRHPPFALRNLTTYMSILVRTPPPRRWRPMIYKDHQDSSRSSNLRCSRPLCSSQLTVGTVSPSALRCDRPVRGSEDAKRRRLVPQDPTACMCSISRVPPFLTASSRTELDPIPRAPMSMFHP